MTAAPLQVRKMLRTYGKQIGIARRLARHRLATLGPPQGEEEAIRAARRRAEGFDYGLMLMVRNKKMGPRFTLAIPLNMLRKISGSPS